MTSDDKRLVLTYYSHNYFIFSTSLDSCIFWALLLSEFKNIFSELSYLISTTIYYCPTDRRRGMPHSLGPPPASFPNNFTSYYNLLNKRYGRFCGYPINLVHKLCCIIIDPQGLINNISYTVAISTFLLLLYGRELILVFILIVQC